MTDLKPLLEKVEEIINETHCDCALHKWDQSKKFAEALAEVARLRSGLERIKKLKHRLCYRAICCASCIATELLEEKNG